MTSPADSSKPIPVEPSPMPAMDENRRSDANLAPQGEVEPSSAPPDSHFTPEGDAEPVPGIPDASPRRE